MFGWKKASQMFYPREGLGSRSNPSSVNDLPKVFFSNSLFEVYHLLLLQYIARVDDWLTRAEKTVKLGGVIGPSYETVSKQIEKLKVRMFIFTNVFFNKPYCCNESSKKKSLA